MIDAQCPECGDQGPHNVLFETGGHQVMTECGNCRYHWLVELDGSTGSR